MSPHLRNTTTRQRHAVIGALIGLSLLVSCGEDPPPAASPGSSAEIVGSAPTVEIGAEVVAAWGKAHFRQGKVVMIDQDSKVTIEHGVVDPKTGKRERSVIESSGLWPVTGGLDGQEVRTGESLICLIKPKKSLWLPCRVTVTERDGAVEVEDHRGTSHLLPKTSLIRPDDERAKGIESFLTREANHREFDREFLAAGSPQIPEGWTPEKGAEVVARFVATSYYGAKIVEIKEGGKIRVDWDGRTFAPMDLDRSRVSPRPTAPRQATVDQFVLVRPKDSSQLWKHCRVSAVQIGALVVVDRDGESSTVSGADIIPIVPRQSSPDGGAPPG